jgi:transcriptional regulator with XRE-family HTH domain
MMQGSLAHRLRVLRAERGLTLRDASSLTGVAKETISDIERGLRHPHDVTVSKLARGYEVPVEELLEEESTVPLGEAPETARQTAQQEAFEKLQKDSLRTYLEALQARGMVEFDSSAEAFEALTKIRVLEEFEGESLTLTSRPDGTAEVRTKESTPSDTEDRDPRFGGLKKRRRGARSG